METERPSPRYSDIDVWEPSDIIEAMIEGQFTAVAAVRAARFALADATLAADARRRPAGLCRGRNLRPTGCPGWRRAGSNIQLAARSAFAAHGRRQGCLAA